MRGGRRGRCTEPRAHLSCLPILPRYPAWGPPSVSTEYLKRRPSNVPMKTGCQPIHPGTPVKRASPATCSIFPSPTLDSKPRSKPLHNRHVRGPQCKVALARHQRRAAAASSADRGWVQRRGVMFADENLLRVFRRMSGGVARALGVPVHASRMYLFTYCIICSARIYTKSRTPSPVPMRIPSPNPNSRILFARAPCTQSHAVPEAYKQVHHLNPSQVKRSKGD